MSQVPENLWYTEEHEWVRKVDEKTVEIGITDFAQSELSDIVYVELPALNQETHKGDTLATVEAVKTVAEVYSPITGRVVAVNNTLEENPELINQDPYGKGWIARIEISDPSELDALLSSEDYKKLLEAA